MGRGLHDEREGTTSILFLLLYWSKCVLFRLKRTWRESRRGKGQRGVTAYYSRPLEKKTERLRNRKEEEKIEQAKGIYKF